MKAPVTWMVGNLATHRRGRILQEILGAEAVERLPAGYGVCMAFGGDFQSAGAEQKEWSRWAEAAGRTLLLMPPFQIGESAEPVRWKIFRAQQIHASGTEGLSRLLANEVRHELSGTLQVPTDVDGSWKDGALNTAYFRKHPHSGLFAITCLPLWSLMLLDRRDTLITWVRSLHSLAGEPVMQDAESASRVEFTPTPDHFAVMLHLCEAIYHTRDEAMATLNESPVLTIPGGLADARLRDLEDAGYAAGGQLTDKGRSALLASPYAVYAQAMEAKRQ
jgi:hypothetical protein